MEWIIVAVVVLVIAAIVLIKSKQRGKSEATDYPYQKQRFCLVPPSVPFLVSLIKQWVKTQEYLERSELLM